MARSWFDELADMWDWMEAEDSHALHELIFKPTITRVAKGKKGKARLAADEDEPLPEIPDELPILPLRGLVVYPQTGVPLTIGQPRSIRLVDDAAVGSRLVGLVASKDPDKENPGPEDLYPIGTVASVHRLFRAPDGTIRLLVQGLARFRLGEFTATEPYLKAKIELAPEFEEDGLEVEALARSARSQFQRIAELLGTIPQELVTSIMDLENPLQTTYLVANFQRMELEQSQELLELDSLRDKLHKLVEFLTHEIEVLEVGQRIQNEARSEIEGMQRDYFLREQLKAIQRELGETDEVAAEVEELRKKIDEAKMPEEADKQARRELDRLSKLSTASAEYGVIRSYIDWLVAIPWAKTTLDNLDIKHARKILDQDHYGLKDVKDRILEFLAVRKLRQERKDELSKRSKDDHDIRREREGVILCFVGPPGVGKTSLGRSIARALEREFIRISLGGVRDEAEIRGHRRTYIGALPGRIVQGVRRSGSRNPVFMLDEVDKLGNDFRGDPSSALLEVLDPEQNNEFRDHYLEVALDLSQVMFITTANSLDTIPGPLRDRMEIIRLSSYTEGDKLEIAKDYLIPRQLRENGLRKSEVKFSNEAIRLIIRAYTRESGVRNLERQIGAVCRKLVTRIAEGNTKTPIRVTPEMVREHLGPQRFYRMEEIATRTSLPGVVTGLSWTPTGGDVLFIEATRMPGGKGFQLSGQLGEVMQESARAALSFVRSRAKQLGIEPDFFQSTDLHLHVPAGAQPKDGPSAGVTMVTALVSLLTGKPIKPHVGMTGEITLRGQVMPVGGIKEKVLAAHRAGLKTIILPARNEIDLDELPKDVRAKMSFKLVKTMDEVLEHALVSKPVRAAKQPATSKTGAKKTAAKKSAATNAAATKTAAKKGAVKKAAAKATVSSNGHKPKRAVRS
ncbi:MAG TPA: endopeptidase La [Anaerolineales bacterium]|nr:endopeptidase La [Anaerolineales bacterium]HRQ93178.1 endopeptidase La [Anaerolineales bacterium]